ncbi:unnamed protein product [Penicillium glandicola]
MTLSRDIREFVAGHGNIWNLDINVACEEFFEKRHKKQSQPSLDQIQCQKGLKYGPGERHRLDVYWPGTVDISVEDLTPERPVVVYFHGGGFRAGDNDISEHMHGNIAKFFASRGMIGVLATYRLLPSARYPDGMHDVAAASRWVHENVARYGGDPNKVVLIGQSAGGAHLAMAHFADLLRQPKETSTFPRAIILQSVPFWYDLRQDRRRVNMRQYYATDDHEDILLKSAGGAFKTAAHCPPDDVPIYVTVGEFDPEEIVNGNLMFIQDWLQRFKRMPHFEVLKGHNHISYALAVGLDDDEVGPSIVRYIEGIVE